MELLEFYSDPIYDYQKYLQNSQICDCMIKMEGSDETISAHRVVLANASVFFFNAFTSGMQEDTDRIVTIPSQYAMLFPKVLEFLYTGIINVEMNELIPLIDHAHYFGIQSLMSALEEMMNTSMTKDKLVKFIEDCYAYSLQEPLNKLIPYMQRFFNELTIAEFSEMLDTITFCKVIGDLQMTVDQKVECLNAFLNGSKPEGEEIVALNSVVGSAVGRVRPCWR